MEKHSLKNLFYDKKTLETKRYIFLLNVSIYYIRNI